MALTSSLRGVTRSSTRRDTGVIIEPPMPCRNRETTKVGSELEKAQAIEPTTEDGDGDAENIGGAEPVGHPAGNRDEDRQRHEVRGQRQLERDRTRAYIAAIAGKEGRDHRRIHVLHEQGDGEYERGDADQLMVVQAGAGVPARLLWS